MVLGMEGRTLCTRGKRSMSYLPSVFSLLVSGQGLMGVSHLEVILQLRQALKLAILLPQPPE